MLEPFDHPCWDILEHVGTCWNMLGHVGDMLGTFLDNHVGTRVDMLGHAGTCWNMLGHVETCWNMLEQLSWVLFGLLSPL